ncbi:MAG TPA: ATPase domain-containing protein, partial [Kofleriaceae bacterium]|nr:ATPase domain-containing protein [Kofleriaceae bacterium]
AEGGRLGEPSVLAIFEETTEAYLARARRMGFDLDAMVDAGLVRIIYLRPLDLSPDEIIAELQHAVTETGARRVVIDSLNGLELALAPSFREDFAASLYRLVGWLSNGGVSVVFTIEVSEAFDEMKFSPHAVSFMAQNILFFRYVEVEGELKKVLAVIKMRRSAHSKSLHGYDVGARGMIVSGPLATYRGILTGVPVPIDGQGTP